MPSVTKERPVHASERARPARGGHPGHVHARRSTPAPAGPGSVAVNAGSSRDVAAGECSLLASIADSARRLGRYVALETGQAREILAVARADASVLVIDYVEGSLADPRLVARIAPEEPQENARILCGLYLADETRGRCRALESEDLDPQAAAAPVARSSPTPLSAIECNGHSYRIRAITPDARPRELRWTSSPSAATDGAFQPVTLRDVIARVEDYEPARTITVDAIAAHAELDDVSTVLVRCELERLAGSRIVLNRGLREGVERALTAGLTMSEIAIRCRRLKRDRRGNTSGETSWLARRIGRLPEAGRVSPTPWVHSRTLALIAREGLGVSPNEVEL